MSPTDFLQQHAARMNAALERMLLKMQPATPERLWQAMHYSLMAGGKRIRPALMFECHAACGGQADIMPAALGVECMHTYSLIHDDLPCMDDDNLRRGRPTSHRQFDEATAILAADALQALAFSLTARLDAPDTLVLALVSRLAEAAGAQGMVGGQMLDMLTETQTTGDIAEVEHIHTLKTGAILRYCCEAGAMLAQADEQGVAACAHYGQAVGLLFQVADDMLDATSTRAALGKSAGKDAVQHKATYVSVLGLEAARQTGERLLDQALSAIAPLGAGAANLRRLARYILERRQ